MVGQATIEQIRELNERAINTPGRIYQSWRQEADCEETEPCNTN